MKRRYERKIREDRINQSGQHNINTCKRIQNPLQNLEEPFSHGSALLPPLFTQLTVGKGGGPAHDVTGTLSPPCVSVAV